MVNRSGTAVSEEDSSDLERSRIAEEISEVLEGRREDPEDLVEVDEIDVDASDVDIEL